MRCDELRRAARQILDAAIRAVDPGEAIHHRLLRQGDALQIGEEVTYLSGIRRIVVVGCGKAAAPMAVAVEEILGDRPTSGVVVTKYGHGQQTKRVRVLESGHPVPDQAGVEGSQAVLKALEGLSPEDLVIVLISGGGSALLPAPVDGVSLEEKQSLTKALLACGADIREMNTIRKHISKLKGGQLARAASPARVLALILSDIVGDPLDAIASGPTVPDPTTYADALAILDKYRIRDAIPRSILVHLEAGAAGKVPETPKPDDPLFTQVRNVMVASNIQALEAAAGEARLRGLTPMILSSSIEGETREVARVHAAVAREARTSGNPVQPPACIISGGETTVTLRGKGKGGRSQEFALAAAFDIAELPDVVILAAGTDGTDGPTDAAGAVVDGRTVSRAREIGLSPRRALDENDAYPFFQQLDDLVITGPTRTNVMDVRLVLLG